ncbi:hypothetical protein SISSUDRAFT_1065564 [Sistotremastrum suecicum HHB10207 ss-3]|uniref:Uncharacterized protein n=1 Tax=Sistotremastrum suecicum HHB10207 ss-3 TaxID=1314776 RepID=A0A165ZB76_9AGAM|nr:hypothetical protein SISSUDRAFT_1065564 [Sistotremastrum suecicum HHB10207 ss-3]
MNWELLYSSSPKALLDFERTVVTYASEAPKPGDTEDAAIHRLVDILALALSIGFFEASLRHGSNHLLPLEAEPPPNSRQCPRRASSSITHSHTRLIAASRILSVIIPNSRISKSPDSVPGRSWRELHAQHDMFNQDQPMPAGRKDDALLSYLVAGESAPDLDHSVPLQHGECRRVTLARPMCLGMTPRGSFSSSVLSFAR